MGSEDSLVMDISGTVPKKHQEFMIESPKPQVETDTVMETL